MSFFSVKTCFLFICTLSVSYKLIAQTDDQLDVKKKTKNSAIAANVGEVDTAHAWKLGLVSSLTFSQTKLDNWAAGGNNLASFSGVAGLYADYSKNRHYWFSLVDASYGLTKVEPFPWRKTQDYLELNTKYGYRFNKNWSLTVFAEGITQFQPGYDYKTEPARLTSNFLAPAFLNEGIGISYILPEQGLSARLSPLTARQVVVTHPDVDETAFGIDAGKSVRHELGASLRVNYLTQVWKEKITFESRLLVFSNYLDNPQNMVVNWRNKLDAKLTKVLTLSFLVHMIYDPNLLFPVEYQVDANGQRVKDAKGNDIVTHSRPHLQLLQTLGIGLGYNISRKI